MWLDEGLVAEIIAFHQHANKKKQCYNQNNCDTKIGLIKAKTANSYGHYL